MINAKKSLGQNFLTDRNVLEKIVNVTAIKNKIIFEVGPGTGALTKFLLERNFSIVAFEVDRESVDYLAVNFPDLKVRNQDFLKLDFSEFKGQQIVVAGNFPYNISSQILFKVLEEKVKVAFELINKMSDKFSK